MFICVQLGISFQAHIVCKKIAANELRNFELPRLSLIVVLCKVTENRVFSKTYMNFLYV